MPIEAQAEAIAPDITAKATEFSTKIDEVIAASDSVTEGMQAQLDDLNDQIKTLSAQRKALQDHIAAATPDEVKVARAAKKMQEIIKNGGNVPPQFRGFLGI